MRNPFMRSTGMLPEVFVGREKEMNELRTSFGNAEAGRAEQTIMYGSFGIGKTSVLIKFKEEIKESSSVVRIPLYVTDNITEMCDLILREARSQLHLKRKRLMDRLSNLGFSFLGVSTSFTLAEVKMNPQSALKSIFETIYEESKKKTPVVILMDDLHRICGPQNKKSRMILSVLSNVLLLLNQEGKNIMFVGTGSFEIFKYIREQDESSVRIFHPIEIKPLNEKEVDDALTLPLKKYDIRLEEEVSRKIFEITEGIPYFVQILGYYCYEERVGNKITLESYDSAYELALTDLAEKDFRSMFKGLSATGRSIMGIIAESDQRDMKYKEIKDNIGSEVSSYMSELIDKNVIVKRERGTYSVRDNMFREYWSEPPKLDKQLSNKTT